MEHINKLLENLAKSFNKDLDKVTQLFEWAKNKLAAETGKTEPSLSVAALHAIRAKLTQAQAEVGKEINVIFFGKDNSTDTNARLRNGILKEFWNNPESRKKVIEDGKIMVLQVKKGDPAKEFHYMYKPIISMEESVEVDGELVPTKGEIWDPTTNDDPLCRDYRKHLDDEGNIENWQYSRPLEPNWKTTLFGIGFFEDTPDITKKVQVRFFGDMGNPSSGQFVCKHLKFFAPYKLKVQVNEKLTSDECYVATARSKPVFAEAPGEEIDVVGMMTTINQNWAEQQDAKGKEPRDLVEVIDFADLKEWHLRRRARKDDDGNILKSERGWDLTNWDEYCLIDQATYLGKREFTGEYAPAVIQHDSIGSLSVYLNYDDHLPMDIPIPADLLICVKTGRGTTKYDRESREKILDADDPDLSINICGYKVLMAYEKIEFPKELIGDL
jgi:hypothetical protein